jgi:hypothetical protein
MLACAFGKMAAAGRLPALADLRQSTCGMVKERLLF